MIGLLSYEAISLTIVKRICNLKMCYDIDWKQSKCFPVVNEIITHTASYQQEDPPSRAWSCSRVLPVQREFFLGTVAFSGFRLRVSVKCLDTIVSVTDAI